MSWIEQDPEATKNLPPVISVMSINDQAMKAVQNLNANITFGASALTRVQEEAISTVVAAANRCRY
jgi:alkylhydroperoxidase family enzyme|tara:strand:+ start:1078 stop:1275 length:198 start_codon:yes stop_codon:yes gene_type:complete